jgi:hypothetical protein
MRNSLVIALVALGWLSVTALALPNEISYEIQARLDTTNHKLYGTERILFTSKADKPLTELYLHLWPNRFAEGSVQAREMGANSFDMLFPNGPDYGYLFVQDLKLDGKEVTYSIDDTILKIQPEAPIAPDQTAEIAIKFVVKIPNALERLGHDQGNYYISWWYPKLSVYDQRGWHPDVAHAFGASEPYEDFAHYSVELTLPSSLVVGATGQLYRETVNPDGTKTLTYIAENVHDFAWVADARYQSETLQWEDVTITSLYFPEDAAAGKRAAQYAKDALEYFSRRFGRYPYPNFTVAEIRGLGFAMEYPQMIQQSYMLYRVPEFFTVLDSVTAHETAHQWFYGLFMNNQLEETWLDEGFATFAETSYIEHKYGKEANSFNTLWLKAQGLGFLVEMLKESNGRAGLLENYTRVARENREAPLSTPLHRVPPGKTVMPYQKGALLLLALENLVGTEKFDQIMQEYYRRYRYKQVTAEDFIKTAEDVSGRDLQEFFAHWLTSTKTLDIALEGMKLQKIESKYVTRVLIRQKGEMRIPIDVEATLADGRKVRQRWEMLNDHGTLTFITDAPIRSVALDPDYALPDLDRSDNVAPGGLNMSPWLDHGMLHKRDADGWTLGVQWGALRLGYSFGLEKIVYSYQRERSFCFADRCTSSWGLSLADDGHIISGRSDLTLRWFVGNAERSNAHKFSLGLFSQNRYNVAEDPGLVRGLRVDYELTSQYRRGVTVTLKLDHRAGLRAWMSDYTFKKTSAELRLQYRLTWQTPLIMRLFWGERDGYEPLERGFDLQRDGNFRGFSGFVDALSAVGLELRRPIPGLNKIDIGFVPFSIGAIVFGNVGLVIPSHFALRADVGVGVTLGVYGSPIISVEYTLWTNTYENNARLGWSVRFEREFRVGF